MFGVETTIGRAVGGCVDGLEYLVMGPFRPHRGAIAQFIMPGKDVGQSADLRGLAITILIGIGAAWKKVRPHPRSLCALSRCAPSANRKGRASSR